MNPYRLTDDYSEGAHPKVLQALINSNTTQADTYGRDEFTERAQAHIQHHLGKPCAIHLVANGTQANLICIAASLRPHEAVVASEIGHIVLRETGAIEALGHKIINLKPVQGKLSVAQLEACLAANALAPHMAKPRLVYLSNTTEVGTYYRLAELEAISAFCKKNALLLMIDGARLGAALAASDVRLADLARLCDVFWIGATKLGALLGEAIVIANPEIAKDFAFHIKQRGGLLCKGRVLGAQFEALFAEGLYFELGKHVNAIAQSLAEGIQKAGYELDAPCESNQVFAVLPDALIERLQKDFVFYVWEKRAGNKSVVRLVTSWATEPLQVSRFLSHLT